METSTTIGGGDDATFEQALWQFTHEDLHGFLDSYCMDEGAGGGGESDTGGGGLKGDADSAVVGRVSLESDRRSLDSAYETSPSDAASLADAPMGGVAGLGGVGLGLGGLGGLDPQSLESLAARLGLAVDSAGADVQGMQGMHDLRDDSTLLRALHALDMSAALSTPMDIDAALGFNAFPALASPHTTDNRDMLVPSPPFSASASSPGSHTSLSPVISSADVIHNHGATAGLFPITTASLPPSLASTPGVHRSPSTTLRPPQPTVIVLPPAGTPEERARRVQQVQRQLVQQRKLAGGGGAGADHAASSSVATAGAGSLARSSSVASVASSTSGIRKKIQVVDIKDEPSSMAVDGQEGAGAEKEGKAAPTLTFPPAALVVDAPATPPTNTPFLFRVAPSEPGSRRKRTRAKKTSDGDTQGQTQALVQAQAHALSQAPDGIAAGVPVVAGGQPVPVDVGAGFTAQVAAAGERGEHWAPAIAKAMVAAVGRLPAKLGEAAHIQVLSSPNRSQSTPPIFPSLGLRLPMSSSQGGTSKTPTLTQTAHQPAPSQPTGVHMAQVAGANPSSTPTNPTPVTQTMSPTTAVPPSFTPTSATTPASGTRPTTHPTFAPPLRPTHNEVEKRYRDSINDRIQELRAMVPSLANSVPAGPQSAAAAVAMAPGTPSAGTVFATASASASASAPAKVHKAAVLRAAVEYIASLRDDNARLRQENEALRTLVGLGVVRAPAPVTFQQPVQGQAAPVQMQPQTPVHPVVQALSPSLVAAQVAQAQAQAMANAQAQAQAQAQALAFAGSIPGAFAAASSSSATSPTTVRSPASSATASPPAISGAASDANSDDTDTSSRKRRRTGGTVTTRAGAAVDRVRAAGGAATLFGLAALVQLGDVVGWMFGGAAPGAHGAHHGAGAKAFVVGESGADGAGAGAGTAAAGAMAAEVAGQTWLSTAWWGLRIIIAIVCVMHLILSVLVRPPSTRVERAKRREEDKAKAAKGKLDPAARTAVAMEAVQNLPAPGVVGVAVRMAGDVVALTGERLFGMGYVGEMVGHVSKGRRIRKERRWERKDGFERVIALPSGNSFYAVSAYLRSLRARLPSFQDEGSSHEDVRVHLAAALHLRLVAIAQTSPRARTLADAAWDTAVEAASSAPSSPEAMYVDARGHPTMGSVEWLTTDPEASRRFWLVAESEWLPSLLESVAETMLRGSAEDKAEHPTLIVAAALGRAFRRWMLINVIKEGGAAVASVLCAPAGGEDKPARPTALVAKAKSRSLKQHLDEILAVAEPVAEVWQDEVTELSEDVLTLARNVADDAVGSGDDLGGWFASGIAAFTAWKRQAMEKDSQSRRADGGDGDEGDDMAWIAVKLAKRPSSITNIRIPPDSELALARRFVNLALIANLSKQQGRADMAARAVSGADDVAEKLRKSRARDKSADSLDTDISRTLEFVAGTWLVHVASWAQEEIRRDSLARMATPPPEEHDTEVDIKQDAAFDAGDDNVTAKPLERKTSSSDNVTGTTGLRLRQDSAYGRSPPRTPVLHDDKLEYMSVLAGLGHLQCLLPVVGSVDKTVAAGLADVVKRLDDGGRDVRIFG